MHATAHDWRSTTNTMEDSSMAKVVSDFFLSLVHHPNWGCSDNWAGEQPCSIVFTYSACDRKYYLECALDVLAAGYSRQK